MKNVVIALGLGLGAGILDIIPMILQKMDKFSITSAFVQWVVMGVIITNSSLFGLKGWLNGAVIGLICAIPIVVLVAKDDIKAVGIILPTSVVLGGLIGFLSEYLKG